MMEALSLYELNRRVRGHLEDAFSDEYWVQAELSDVRIHSTGHCYLELVEKNSWGNNLIAKARAMIWNQTFRLLRPYFERETGQAFVSGLKVLVRVAVSFHELYGYSLTIVDIDPSYTVGDMVHRRKEILLQLEAEGVLTLNKELPMPVLPQRVAVVSSATAAGYDDFCDQLLGNPYGFVFYPHLFPAMMQGERVESSVIAALDRIYARIDCWDVVVIIRGGGATSELSNFDSYLLAANCAQFPLPLITGIGHERDDTVVDAVAHTRVKTPTAAAEYLINRVHETASDLAMFQTALTQAVSGRLERERKTLAVLTEKLPRLFSTYRWREEQRLQVARHKLEAAVNVRLLNETHRLQLLEHQVHSASPERLLKRGYSITLKDGKAVTDASLLRDGDKLVTRVAQGEFESVVTI